MSITIPVSVKVVTLVMIVMLKSTSVSPPLAFAVSALVGNATVNDQRPIKMAGHLGWLKTVSSDWILMGRYNHSLSPDTVVMISIKLPSHC